MSDSELIFTGERFVPGIVNEQLEAEHIQRYYSMDNLVKDKNILDAACGEGYGSYYLSKFAKSVIGIDLDEETVIRANEKYSDANNLSFMQGDIGRLYKIPDNSIDVVISFETIEHVPEETQYKFLEEIKRVLVDDGILVMSTPNKKLYSDERNYRNEFHIKEFYKDEFYNFLSSKFKFVTEYEQYNEIVSVIDSKKKKEEHVKYLKDRSRYNGEGMFILALASDVEIKDYKISSIYMKPTTQYNAMLNRILLLQDEEDDRNLHIKKLDYEIDEKNHYVKSLQKEVKQQTEQIEQQTEKISDMKQTIVNKEGHIEQLLEKEREYERVKNSKTYKLAKKFQKAGNFLLPKNSKRRFFAKVTWNTIRHPVLTLHMIKPKRIKNFFKYMKKEGVSGVSKRYSIVENIEKEQLNPEKDLQIIKVGKTKKVSDYAKLVIPQFDEIEVSIIIPVYNEFDYTYNCIKSIIENSKDVAYEIIVANDCSTDITSNIEQMVENVRLITTKENCRFLLNCNNAAKYAEGKYILFLNNDTQVQANWLKPLVELIESNADIGMVGSKLVYPSGLLQEAGGIIWKDASAWNYGNLNKPSNSEYNYVKEVDYISGAAIMIKKSLWNEIGGFDERYVPAYCEDSDLAFEVRKHGYKVMYQPLSVVVHFEGVSNGTDTSAGQKSYQIKNQKKFYDKWKDVLENEHFNNGENVFVARDRKKDMPCLLMIDHYVPQYDKDAGSRTVFQYINLFVKKGFNVKFIGDNFYRHEPYTSVLQQLGVEVLYGPDYKEKWQEWIKINSEFIDYVFLNRPHISEKYIDYVKENTKAKIIYYGHDLHFLRELREYELIKDSKILNSSNEWKGRELALMRKADVTFYPSYVEIEEIEKMDNQINAKVLSAYMFDSVPLKEYNFSNRKDIMFIGGFVHKPNTDAVTWFVNDIFPLVLKQIPDMKFYVLGSNPPDSILNLKSNNVIIKGFVTDDELSKIYDSCRIAVVPLRYGAGIKGKVVEAMRYGIPVVTTSVGVEGITGIKDIIEVADDSKTFAEKICKLYNDDKKLKAMSKYSNYYINEFFSLDSAWNSIKMEFERR